MTGSNNLAMVMASFAGDSLALAPHWIYDVKQIEKRWGRPEDLLAPARGGYHRTKQKGEFTHYGDQEMVLLESVAEKKAFDPTDFSTRWQALFADYDGYKDGATKTTLANLEAGWDATDAGSTSNDLAGAGRVAPLVCLLDSDLDALDAAARLQTKMTHNNAAVLDAAAFFARTSVHCLSGDVPVEAMEKAARSMPKGSSLPGWMEDGVKSADRDTVQAVAGFGQNCHVDDAFPATVHLLAKFHDNLEEALVQSTMAGGDSAARNAIVGMVLGAALGMKAIPGRWLDDLVARERITELVEQII